jgi:hypothetical protein
MLAAKRTGPIAKLGKDLRRLIAKLVAPRLYTNVGGWMQRVRAPRRPDAYDPSHGQNLRALLADPMVNGDDANAIATALDDDFRMLDAASL